MTIDCCVLDVDAYITQKQSSNASGNYHLLKIVKSARTKHDKEYAVHLKNSSNTPEFLSDLKEYLEGKLKKYTEQLEKTRNRIQNRKPLETQPAPEIPISIAVGMTFFGGGIGYLMAQIESPTTGMATNIGALSGGLLVGYILVRLTNQLRDHRERKKEEQGATSTVREKHESCNQFYQKILSLYENNKVLNTQ